jgi:hypothetical protein
VCVFLCGGRALNDWDSFFHFGLDDDHIIYIFLFYRFPSILHFWRKPSNKTFFQPQIPGPGCVFFTTYLRKRVFFQSLIG